MVQMQAMLLAKGCLFRFSKVLDDNIYSLDHISPVERQKLDAIQPGGSQWLYWSGTQ
jgi:hypothetical protein